MLTFVWLTFCFSDRAGDYLFGFYSIGMENDGIDGASACYPIDYFLVSSGRIRRSHSLSQSQELRAGKVRFEPNTLPDDVKQYCKKKAQKEDLSAMGPDFDPELLNIKPPSVKDGSKVLIFGVVCFFTPTSPS